MKGSDNVTHAIQTPAVENEVIVLLVDDSKTIRRSASKFLSNAGYTVITAVDGFEALSKVVEHRPALIFADIMMPRLDGYQTCALIKNNADYRNIPIVMLSSKDGLFDKARARVVGSDAHLSKPFTAESLAAAVEEHLGGSEEAFSADAGNSIPTETTGV
jgi:twitching motility two-component system response regulator PilG